MCRDEMADNSSVVQTCDRSHRPIPVCCGHCWLDCTCSCRISLRSNSVASFPERAAAEVKEENEQLKGDAAELRATPWQVAQQQVNVHVHERRPSRVPERDHRSPDAVAELSGVSPKPRGRQRCCRI